MKKTRFLILLIFTTSFYGQLKGSIFSKDPIINLETWQQHRVNFGFFLGLNSYDYKFSYKTAGGYIQTRKINGFNVGLIADLRLHEYLVLRFEPGLYVTKRTLEYPNSYFKTPPTNTNKIREINSTYIHLPLLLKFFALRTGNIRPYLLGGFSTTLNLSSNEGYKNDNSRQVFRVKKWTPNYELGIGIDIFAEYFIFSPSIRGVFGLNDELIRDNDPNSPWTGSVESMKTRGFFINFSFH